jgi:hypothetical protein
VPASPRHHRVDVVVGVAVLLLGATDQGGLEHARGSGGVTSVPASKAAVCGKQSVAREPSPSAPRTGLTSHTRASSAAREKQSKPHFVSVRISTW